MDSGGGGGGRQELWFWFLGSSFANHNQEAEFALKSAKAFQRIPKKGAAGEWLMEVQVASVVCCVLGKGLAPVGLCSLFRCLKA